MFWEREREIIFLGRRTLDLEGEKVETHYSECKRHLFLLNFCTFVNFIIHLY